MATFNSKTRRAIKCGLVAATFIFAAGIVFADESQNKIFAARAEAEFHRAQEHLQSGTNDSAAAWQLARACFDFADFAKTKTERAALARQGIAACQQLLARDFNSAPAHYYLGMNFGQLARTETFGALRLVKEMEHEFKIAIELDEPFDYAGPERNLGLLYRDAPGWPTSIGNHRKAREWLERAAAIATDYPENRLNLLESFLKWNDRADAQCEMKALDELWPQAQKKFVGESWERSWVDWEKRRDMAREHLNEMLKSSQAPHK
jgi:tetratricopeptide (TPR) repeat protein